VGTNPEQIINVAQKLLDDPITYEAMSKASNPYGDGTACIQIVDYLKMKK
jgi:UDP-N-acetylglucosamine 2-epimerase (non-hydrolysing)